MKRLIALFFVLCIASSFVIAQGQMPETTGQQGQPETIAAGNGLVNETPGGLSVALTRVTNENARQRLEQNIQRFRERYQQRLQKMEEVEIEEVDEETGAVTVRAREEVRFLGFIKGKATKRFEMDRNGNINERAPWYSLFYSEPAEE